MKIIVITTVLHKKVMYDIIQVYEQINTGGADTYETGFDGYALCIVFCVGKS